MIVDIVIGTDWPLDVVVQGASGMTEAQLVTEMTSATATCTIENSAGTVVATPTCVVDGATRKVSLALAAATTAGLAAQTGLYADLRYTTTAPAKIRAVKVDATFRIVANPWE